MDRVNFWERTSINVVFNVIRTLIMALIGVFLIPYYIDNLGSSVYAVIPLATTVSSYVLIISDALVGACGRYVRLAISESEEKADAAFCTDFFGVLRIVLATVVPCLAIAYFSPMIFNVPDGMENDVQVMFALILISSLVVSFSSVFNTVFFAYNIMYDIQIAKLVYTLSQVLIIVVMFNLFDPSLVDIGYAYLVSSLFLLLCLYVMSRRLPYVPKISYHLYDKSLFKKMGVLSIWSTLNKIGSLLYIQLSLVLVNMYLGSELQAGFAILSTIVSMVGTATLSISASIEPLLYRMYAEKQEERLRRTVYVGKKVLGFFMAMPLAFLTIFSSEIFTTWVGSEFLYLVDFMGAVSIVTLMRCCALSSSSIPVLYLKNNLTMMDMVFFGILNFILSILVLQFTDLGLDGAVYTWAVCYLFEETIYIFICGHVTHATLKETFLPVFQCYLVFAVCAMLFYGLSQIIDVGSSWLEIIPLFIVLFGIYMVFLLRVLFTYEETKLIRGVLPGPFKKLLKKKPDQH